MTTSTKIVIGLTAAFVIYNEFQKRNNTPKVFYVNHIPGNYNGCVLPPFGIFVNKNQKGNQMLLSHELQHWKQYQRDGLIKFAYNYTKYQNEVGYDLNPYEIEARLLSGEKLECINNFTNCVRNGTALTVQNENFRAA